ncbi:MAG: hypothetical protein IJJ13_08570 [Lachnospiraceae bacterium]|nr:hypothetical protein [Lachnospiraceae bacterium]
MKLTGKLKEKDEKAENKEQEKEKELISKAGMILSDDDLDQVAGGVNSALTELDEEGIDVGVEYKLEFNSSWR